MPPEVEAKRVRLLLLDNHALFRASLARVLASEDGFEVVGECSSVAQACEILQRSNADIVLLDFDLGMESGNEFISAARRAGYEGRFLIVSAGAEPKLTAIALQLGASGIFLKSETPDRLIRAIQLVASGEFWVDPKVIQMLAEQLVDQYQPVDLQRSTGALGDRERNVLLGILGGLTNKRIGLKMGISESSVKNVVQRLFNHAGVKTRSQLVRVALEGSLGTARKLISRNQPDASHREKRPSRPRRTPPAIPTVSQSSG